MTRVFSYDFEPSRGVQVLASGSARTAKPALKRKLAIASRGMISPPPNAIILFHNGSEIWRWTQADRQQAAAMNGKKP